MEEICQCGIFAVGRCQSCQRGVCGTHSQLIDGKLQCSDCLAQIQKVAERAQAAVETRERQAAAEEHDELVTRVEAAVQSAVERLRGTRQLPLVRARDRLVSKVSAGGSHGILWTDSAEEVGSGWYALRWEDFHDFSGEGDYTSYTNVLLSREGCLFLGINGTQKHRNDRSDFRPGRRFSWARGPVLGVVKEIQIGDLGAESLKRLECDLLELADGSRSLFLVP